MGEKIEERLLNNAPTYREIQASDSGGGGGDGEWSQIDHFKSTFII